MVFCIFSGVMPMDDRTIIRRERPGDEPGIRTVNLAAFPTDAEARLVDCLRAAGSLTVSMVADLDGRIVGHAAFSPVTAANGALGIGLGPVAVLESHRRHGLAAQIIRAGLESSRAAGFTWAVVLGGPAYYGRFGFAVASRFGLSDTYDAAPYFQAMSLIPDGLPIGAGVVRYHAAFADCGC